MPAKSKEQQRLFGMVHAYQKGELKNPSKEVKDIAKDISYKDANDFAKTKHKGLPNKVKKESKTNEGKEMENRVIKINEQQLRQIVTESVKRVLKETELDYDIDNFSGRWNRGQRYNIIVDGEVYYSDVPEESVDELVVQLERKPWVGNIEVVER